MGGGVWVATRAPQQQLAVYHLGALLCGLIDVVREQFGLQVHADDVGQVLLEHLVEEASLGAAVRQLAPALGLTGVLCIKLAAQRLDACLQGRDAITPALGEFVRLLWVVSHHQAMDWAALLPLM